MSRSKKDGVGGGGHRNVQGKEYWSRRCDGQRSMMTPGRQAKTLTHRFERRAARDAIRRAWELFLEINRVAALLPPSPQ